MKTKDQIENEINKLKIDKAIILELEDLTEDQSIEIEIINIEIDKLQWVLK